jgi:hypothetical protein
MNRRTLRKNNLNAYKFLKGRAKDLPKLTDKSTGMPINHETNLKAVFDGKGARGVNQYVQAVKAVTMRDTGGWKQKIKGWLLVLKSKIQNKL